MTPTQMRRLKQQLLKARRTLEAATEATPQVRRLYVCDHEDNVLKELFVRQQASTSTKRLGYSPLRYFQDHCRSP